MPTQIDWGLLRQSPNIAEAFTQGRAAGELQQRQKATQDILAGYAKDPSGPVPNALAFYDPQVFATLSQNHRQQQVADRATADALRTDQARTLLPDVLAGVGLGGARPSSAPAAAGAEGDITVTAPVQHKTVADLFALDPELAGSFVTKIGAMQEQQRNQLAAEADMLAVAAFAARQVPYAKRKDVIESYRRQLGNAGFSSAEIDDFDPTDEAIGAAIAHSLGIKGALSQQLAEQKFAWDKTQDVAREKRAAQSEARSQYYRQRADSRAQVRFNERALDRAALAGGRINPNAPADNSDLDY